MPSMYVSDLWQLKVPTPQQRQACCWPHLGMAWMHAPSEGSCRTPHVSALPWCMLCLLSMPGLGVLRATSFSVLGVSSGPVESILSRCSLRRRAL